MFGGALVSNEATKPVEYLNDCFCYDFESKQWKRSSNGKEKPKPRHFHTASTRNNNEIYVFGGKGNKYYNDLYCYFVGTYGK